MSESLVGISHECDFPAEISDRPILTEAKIDASGTSREIDTQVRSLVGDGLSVYRIREDALREAAPDVIITQDQCEVCAVSTADVQSSAERLLGKSTEIVSLSPNTMESVLQSFATVATALGQTAAGSDLVSHSRDRLEAISTGTKRSRSKPRVACIEWLDPPMVAGNWIPEMVTLCGGVYEQAAPGEHSKTIDWQDVLDYAPDVVLLMPCGFKLEQTKREIPGLRENALWQQLPAVKNNRVYAVDGNAYLNRPGPRIIDSAELIAGLVQPDLFATLIPPGSYEPCSARI